MEAAFNQEKAFLDELLLFSRLMKEPNPLRPLAQKLASKHLDSQSANPQFIPSQEVDAYPSFKQFPHCKMTPPLPSHVPMNQDACFNGNILTHNCSSHEQNLCEIKLDAYSRPTFHNNWAYTNAPLEPHFFNSLPSAPAAVIPSQLSNTSNGVEIKNESNQTYEKSLAFCPNSFQSNDIQVNSRFSKTQLVIRPQAENTSNLILTQTQTSSMGVSTSMRPTCVPPSLVCPQSASIDPKLEFGLTDEENNIFQMLLSETNSRSNTDTSRDQQPSFGFNSLSSSGFSLDESEDDDFDEDDESSDSSDSSPQEWNGIPPYSASLPSLASTSLPSKSKRILSTTRGNNGKRKVGPSMSADSFLAQMQSISTKTQGEGSPENGKFKSWLPEKTYIQMLEEAQKSNVEFLEDNFPVEAGSIFFTRRPFKKTWKLTTDWKNCGRKKEKIEGGSCLRIFYRRHKDNADLRKRMILHKDHPDVVLHHITLFNRRTSFRRSSKVKM